MNNPRTIGAVLWLLQLLLAALFLFAGAFKLAMAPAELSRQAGFPAPFMQFIALAELAGGLGLLLPGLTRVRPGLTPLAAAGLAVIMAGAVVVSLVRVSAGAALMPLLVGALLVAIVHGRRDWGLSIR